jgi:transposase
MQVLHPRCCGLDVHKRSITACCLWFNHARQRQEETRQFGTQTTELRRLTAWLREQVKHLVMD